LRPAWRNKPRNPLRHLASILHKLDSALERKVA
jgi:hypothetical protein